MGKTDNTYGEKDDKVALLDCPCGSEGCWTFAARIIETSNSIVWRDFEQVHRNGEISEDLFWKYDPLGVLEFNKEEYLKEIEKIKI